MYTLKLNREEMLFMLRAVKLACQGMDLYSQVTGITLDSVNEKLTTAVETVEQAAEKID